MSAARDARPKAALRRVTDADRAAASLADAAGVWERAVRMVHFRSDGSLREVYADQYDAHGRLLPTSRIARARSARRSASG